MDYINFKTVIIEYLGIRRHISVDYFLNSKIDKEKFLQEIISDFIILQIDSLPFDRKEQLFKELKQKIELESSFNLNIEPEICTLDSETNEILNCK